MKMVKKCSNFTFIAARELKLSGIIQYHKETWQNNLRYHSNNHLTTGTEFESQNMLFLKRARKSGYTTCCVKITHACIKCMLEFMNPTGNLASVLFLGLKQGAF